MTIDIAENIRRHGFKRLLLAVSGGLDSICLAHYFIENRESLGIKWLGIAHVHHGLREGTADRDTAFVEEFAKSHGVPFFLKKLDGEALKTAEGSLEENAREARYKALMEIAVSCERSAVSNEPSAMSDEFMLDGKEVHGSYRSQSSLQDDKCTGSFDENRLRMTKQEDSHLRRNDMLFVSRLSSESEATSKCQRHDLTPHTCIVTAHHAGDQSETMYMRLKRGTTLAGLRGIQKLREMSCEPSAASNEPSAMSDEFMQGCKAANVKVQRENDNVITDPGTGSGMTSPKAGMTNANDNVTGSCGENRLRMTKNSQPQREQSDRPHTSYLIFRPFLNITRTELLYYAHEHNLKWCEDESNADVKFARNSIRHQLLPHLEKEVPGATKQLCKIAELADKAYAKVIEKCDMIFSVTLEAQSADRVHGSYRSQSSLQDDKCTGSCSYEPNSTKALKSQVSYIDFAQDDKSFVFRLCTFASGSCTKCWSRSCPSELGHDSQPTHLSSFVSINKKKLNKILAAHRESDLSELFRLWLSEKGFRFPTGFFYSSKEPAHIKIPVRAVYRKRSIVKIRHTVWICEFKDTESASKFVSCGMKEKGLYE